MFVYVGVLYKLLEVCNLLCFAALLLETNMLFEQGFLYMTNMFLGWLKFYVIRKYCVGRRRAVWPMLICAFLAFVLQL